jgi:hypothetical protein
VRSQWYLALFLLAGPVSAAVAQSAQPVPVTTTVSYGSLSQNDLAIRMRNDEVEIRFVPLDPRIMRLLANDAFQSLRSLVESRTRQIDSVASRAGVTKPGLALVSFYGLRADTRFDPQTLTVRLRSRALQPLGLIPINSKFSSHQLAVREQASAIYLFEEDLPVDDSFTLSYAAMISDDWSVRQPVIDRERARVAARAREQPRDTAR